MSVTFWVQETDDGGMRLTNQDASMLIIAANIHMDWDLDPACGRLSGEEAYKLAGFLVTHNPINREHSYVAAKAARLLRSASLAMTENKHLLFG